MNDLLPELARFAPGAVGSLVSMVWMREAWSRRVVLFIGGVVFARYAAPQVAPYVHIPEGFLLGFILGFCSMSFFGKVLETWQEFNAGAILRDAVRKFLGLPAVAAKD